MKLPPGKSSVPLSLALVAFTLAAGSGILGRYALMWPSLVAMWAFLALFFQGLESLRTFTFTFWVLAFFFGGLTFPALFGEVWGFDQKVLIVPLIQVILFGMERSSRFIRASKRISVGP